MTTHKLKTWPPYYRDLLEGRKTFELRWNDRNFQVGDVLHLVEYDPKTGPTGNQCYRVVSYVLPHDLGNLPGFGLREGFVILGVQRGPVTLPMPTANGSDDQRKRSISSTDRPPPAWLRLLTLRPCELCGRRVRCWRWHVEILTCPVCHTPVSEFHERAGAVTSAMIAAAENAPYTTES